MPGYKRKFRSRGGRRKRRLYGRRRKRISRPVRRARPEVKGVTLALASNFTSAGALFELFTISQGDGVGQRIGNKIRPVSVSWNVQLRPNSSAAGVEFNTHVRAMFLRVRAGDPVSAIYPAVLTRTDYDDFWVLRDTTRHLRYGTYFGDQAAFPGSEHSTSWRGFHRFRRGSSITYDTDGSTQPIDAGRYVLWFTAETGTYYGNVTGWVRYNYTE